MNQVFTNKEKVWESYSVLSKAASLSEENEAENCRDDGLDHGEDKEGRLYSSAQLLL